MKDAHHVTIDTIGMPKEVELEDVPCPLACDQGDKILFSGCDKLHGLAGDFDVVQCEGCGLIRTNPRPTAATIGYYYPDNYGPYLGTIIQTHIQSRGTLPTWKRIARWLLELNIQRLPKMEPGRMLEIGCASGSFLQQMTAKGWDVEGIEFSKMAATRALENGYHVHAGSLETAPDPKSPYELIVGWMVLEHLHDPVIALQKLNRWGVPGAQLVLSVPNAGSLDFRMFKNDGYALQLPNHLYHYTQQTLAKVLSAGGWQIEKVHHQRILSNWFGGLGQLLDSRGYSNSIVSWLRRYPREAGRLHYLFYPLAFLLGVFGQTGRMTVWARRMDD